MQELIKQIIIFKMAIYPCVQCDEECLDGSIQCVACEMWVHSACVPMSEELLSEWSDANMQFLCRNCCFTDGQFNGAKSLETVCEFYCLLNCIINYLI